MVGVCEHAAIVKGLDPRCTAALFSSAVCTGEKLINGDDCFVLPVDANPPTVRSRSRNTVEIIRHSIRGYFSQRTGLLVRLDDSRLLRMKSSNEENVYWETTIESLIRDYRLINGINVAHSGEADVHLLTFGENRDGLTRMRMEEVWTVEEVDFSVEGSVIYGLLLASGGSQGREGKSW
ncbi:uncharacterized protein A4U43_C02F660 [Asparagus officinalis]|uniref:Uncharacterized protein n=1 Tax=Asparagus officinalis TaxID=4686 RepID=A0A5P1FER8_ASPOF|nr:uncharacterized protein A4U43_C02F660 [Asparagus officinalis]